jgi:hypothetical protein
MRLIFIEEIGNLCVTTTNSFRVVQINLFCRVVNFSLEGMVTVGLPVSDLADDEYKSPWAFP